MWGVVFTACVVFPFLFLVSYMYLISEVDVTLMFAEIFNPVLGMMDLLVASVLLNYSPSATPCHSEEPTPFVNLSFMCFCRDVTNQRSICRTSGCIFYKNWGGKSHFGTHLVGAAGINLEIKEEVEKR